MGGCLPMMSTMTAGELLVARFGESCRRCGGKYAVEHVPQIMLEEGGSGLWLRYQGRPASTMEMHSVTKDHNQARRTIPRTKPKPPRNMKPRTLDEIERASLMESGP